MMRDDVAMGVSVPHEYLHVCDYMFVGVVWAISKEKSEVAGCRVRGFSPVVRGEFQECS
jgi:hypothetical protein